MPFIVHAEYKNKAGDNVSRSASFHYYWQASEYMRMLNKTRPDITKAWIQATVEPVSNPPQDPQ